MPPRNVAVLRWQSELCRLHEIHRDKGRDIGDRIMCSTNERVGCELAVENWQERRHPRFVGLPPRGDLGNFSVLHGGVEVAKDLGHRRKQVLLDSAIST